MNNLLKFELDLEGLERQVTENIKSEVRVNVSADVGKIIKDAKQAFSTKIETHLESYFSKNIVKKIDDIFNTITQNVLEKSKIKVSGGWNQEPTEYAISDYIEKKFNDKLEDLNIEELIDQRIKRLTENNRTDLENLISNKFNKLNEEIGNRIKTTFDEQARKTFSDNVVKVLFNEKAYKDLKKSLLE